MATPKQLDHVLRQKLRESNIRNIERIERALKLTLAELDFLEAGERTTPGAYTAPLARIRAKRDRQHANLQATKAYLAALQG